METFDLCICLDGMDPCWQDCGLWTERGQALLSFRATPRGIVPEHAGFEGFSKERVLTWKTLKDLA